MLDDGSTQTTFVEYNAVHRVTRSTDPLGRTTIYTYGTNNTPDTDPAVGRGVDLLKVEQVNGQNRDLLLSATYNAQHAPVTITDASGQVWTFTYNGLGQMLTATTPARAGITEDRTTTYAYDANGYLQSVTGPAAGANASYTYDGYGRLRTATDADAYTLTADYDALDRMTKVTFPDGTFDQATYNRLDVEQQQDRLGRITRVMHDALRHPVTIQDPKQQITTLIWCGCGALDKLVDANGHATSWTRDLEGRVTQKQDADGSAASYVYENTTSRLKSTTDAKSQTTGFTYFVDDRPRQVTHTGASVATPDVSLTYSPVYPRIATRTDGTGTTAYAYNPVSASALGSGRLASVDGPWANDTVTYTYDEVGRVSSRAINGVATTVGYDNLWRPSTVTNALGTFNYGFDGITSRLASVTSSNGPSQAFSYLNNAGDRLLSRIQNTTAGGATLSQFDYAYRDRRVWFSTRGISTSWLQRNGSPCRLRTPRRWSPSTNRLAISACTMRDSSIRDSVMARVARSRAPRRCWKFAHMRCRSCWKTGRS